VLQIQVNVQLPAALQMASALPSCIRPEPVMTATAVEDSMLTLSLLLPPAVPAVQVFVETPTKVLPAVPSQPTPRLPPPTPPAIK
jgi:hypothetical protein